MLRLIKLYVLIYFELSLICRISIIFLEYSNISHNTVSTLSAPGPQFYKNVNIRCHEFCALIIIIN